MKVLIRGERPQVEVALIDGEWVPQFKIGDNDHRAMLNAMRGSWVGIGTEHVFSNQFNGEPVVGVTELGLRINAGDVAEYDYEGDAVLQQVVEALHAGRISCHHYQHTDDGTLGAFVDLFVDGVRYNKATASTNTNTLAYLANALPPKAEEGGAEAA